MNGTPQEPSSKDEESVFSEALGFKPGPERQAYLEQACANNIPLRQQVEDLLRAHEALGNRGEQPGDRLGPYILIEKIGEGGFGSVWRARQERPIRREVAVKIIKLGKDTKQVIRRFEAERQALAMMEHGNIAKIFEAGADDQGRPYFAMELVRGPRITDYCDEHHLSTEARLQLFIQVCRAMQHAHDKGIIHRDLKPSNILVSDDRGLPSPKIIDFGIAKATDQRLTEETLFTASGQILGTLAYMSPEQTGMKGLEIDTRSDIYSLGALLYELLSGQPPVTEAELQRLSLDEVLRAIRRRNPPRPSVRLATLPPEELETVARRRQTDPVKLPKLLNSGLDWVALRCLEKNRNNRYQNAGGLADRLQRHLDNKPPSDMCYRILNWIRRRQLALGSVVAVLFVIAGFYRWQESRPAPWRTVPINVSGYDQPWVREWHNIEWFGAEGWLTGAIDANDGSGQFIGHGILLHTLDGGKVWKEVSLTNSDAGAGTVSHFGDKTWDGIGPIQSIDTIPDFKANGVHVTNVWIVTLSGIFFSTNALSPEAQWKRVTPSPDDPAGYSYFSGMQDLDNGREFYAYGWQGISHWERGGDWKVQLGAYDYCITSVYVVDQWKKEAWAVANAGGSGELSRGALFHLNGTGGIWERVPLKGINLRPHQGFNGIIKLRLSDDLIIVGQGGIILRSTSRGADRVWERSEPVKQDLAFIVYDTYGMLWVVG